MYLSKNLDRDGIASVLFTSGGSGLPEPENPTGFEPFFQTRSYPNPNISKIHKPEPEVQTRGYQKFQKLRKIRQIWSKCLRKCFDNNFEVKKHHLNHTFFSEIYIYLKKIECICTISKEIMT